MESAPTAPNAVPTKPVTVTFRRVRRRGSTPRARTVSARSLSKEERRIQHGPPALDLEDAVRPKVRGDCANGPRPCPWAGCRFHIYLDVNPRSGSIKLNFPHLEVWQLAETCALDVADRGGATLEDVGLLLNLVRERIRQLEVNALDKMRAHGVTLGL